jgi:predicted transcriptional regulator
MKIDIPDISKQIYKEETLGVLERRYSTLGPMWVNYQMEWMCEIYASYKDHDKFLIVIYLVKKTLDFYSRHFTKLNYEEFYSNDSIEIEKFTVSEISKELNIPKESTRRKVLELENEGTIRIRKKRLLLDRSRYYKSKPVKSIQRVSRFLARLSELCEKENVLKKNISSEELELTIKNNFSYIWKIYYELQIPMMINYKKIFKDLETFHIFGICVASQHLHAKKLSDDIVGRVDFVNDAITADEIQGINAMSLSDISGIPRATVIRKLKKLLKKNFLTIDDKKHYKLTGDFAKVLLPIQKTVITQLSDFSAKIFNLSLLDKRSKNINNKISTHIRKYL